MPEVMHHFAQASVLLPFDLDAEIAAWSEVQRRMVRERPEAFTRDEWGYLASFVDSRALHAIFTDAFGERVPGPMAARVLRPRGAVALWLPNNVSLLGPLTLILLALTGNRVRAKAGASAEDLASAFIAFADGARFTRTVVEQFDRHDPRNLAMAAEARVRIAFGSDAGVEAIDALPHPVDSIAFYFRDRRSEAWLDPDRIDDGTVATLAKVFAIYGQTGCTSPRRAVLIGGTPEGARTLTDRLVEAWPRVVRGDLPMHLASQNVMAAQWAAAVGWDAHLTPHNRAVVAVGPAERDPLESPFLLTIVSASLDEALARLPANIQTIGHNFADVSGWAERAVDAGAKRVVPLAQMHHFGPVWDGFPWWQETFEDAEVRA